MFFRHLFDVVKQFFARKKVLPIKVPGKTISNPTIREVINKDGDVIWIVKRNNQFRLYRVKRIRDEEFNSICNQEQSEWVICKT